MCKRRPALTRRTRASEGEQLFDTPNCALVVTVVAFSVPGAEIVNPKSCCIGCHYTAQLT